jgi:hypothetical protein
VHTLDLHAVPAARSRLRRDDRPPGYRVLDLQDDGGIATEVVWLEGYAR